MKLLHTADWHLCSPLLGYSPEQTQYLKEELWKIPGKIADLCRIQGCDLLLLAGDLFDGPYTRDGLDILRGALEEAAVPVFISPGNHDFCGPNAPWTQELFPGNVHIFTRPILESAALPALSCRVYGAGFASLDCPPLLDGFHADCEERYAVALLHGDPTQSASPYCPVTAQQVRESGLDYLALGHIHKTGSFRAGSGLCAWPGCPMGRGFDELGQKGVLVVTLEDEANAEFLPLDTPKFFDWEVPVEEDAAASLTAALPPVGSRDFYRIALTGECPEPELPALAAQLAHFPNLTLRDRTTPPIDVWAAAGEDTLEGVYFRLLKEAMDGAGDREQAQISLAAKLSRQLLDGKEVTLP